MLFFEVKKELQKVGTIVLAALIFFVFEYLQVFLPLRSRMRKLFNPIFHLNVLLINKLSQPYLLIKRLYKSGVKVRDLELRLAEATALLADLEKYKKENQDLKQILNNTDRNLEEVVVTSPIASMANPAIAAGSADGVKRNSMVFYKNTLLGVIEEVADNYATLSLLSQKNGQTIMAQTQEGVQGLVVGDGRRVKFTEVPNDEVLHIGDLVTTLGQKGIEKGVSIGRIIDIEEEMAASTQTAVIEQYVNYYECSIVEVR